MKYSLIIPVYNRPEDIEEMLGCLTRQTFTDFEVIVVESGSTIKSDQVVDKYQDKLDIRYFYKSNEGQGYSRNYGMARAKGDFFIILDSDLILRDEFIEKVDAGIKAQVVDAYGSADRAHLSFTAMQKAVDYILTSFLTTGGMRGSKAARVKFYPRSYNMGFSREVYEATEGFSIPFFGEDIELSARIMDKGFKVGYIEEAYVYHKRKNSLSGFWKQMYFFGRARINIHHLMKGTLKLVHFIPTLFTLYFLVCIAATLIWPAYGFWAFLPVVLYILSIFAGALIRYRSLTVALLSMPAVVVQMFGYGSGLLKQLFTHTLTGKGAEKFKPQKDL